MFNSYGSFGPPLMLRLLTNHDLEAVWHLDQHYADKKISLAAFTSVWSRRACLGIGLDAGRPTDSCCNSNMVGYMLTMMIPPNMFITRFVVAPQFRRRKLASRMIGHVIRIGQANQPDFTTVIRLSRDSDLREHKLFQANNFIAEPKVMRAHFNDGSDGYRFVFTLDKKAIVASLPGVSTDAGRDES